MKFIDLAPKYFLEGYSCSEAIARCAVDMGLASEDFISIATSFSGGMSSGCLCGAVAGSQMVLGLLHGKLKDNKARQLAKEFYEKFSAIHKVTCCKVLTKDFKDFHSPERKNHCVNMVYDCSKILDEMLEKELSAVSK
ncbi:C_GCAxxG_C_C family protein [bacterium]|nr:C_GCAxxG_C_C family protein [bacterium]